MVYKKNIVLYPSQEELDNIILRLSPTTLSEILRECKIPINGGTLETIKRRVKFLVNSDKVVLKNNQRIYIIYSKIYEIFKKKEIERRSKSLVGGIIRDNIFQQ